jgi:hypothetical protein
VRRNTTQFQCNACEAVNFLDGKGNIVDTPVAFIEANERRTQGSIRPATTSVLRQRTLSPELSPQAQEKPVFCRTCLQNQHLYNETLANYFPNDDNDPRYREFEARLPQFKADLEKRYPLICRKCAPLAQQQIHQADYYGMAQNAAKLCAETRSRGGRVVKRAGTRDDWVKRTVRAALRIVGLVAYAGLYTQVAYHLYGLWCLFSTPEEFAMEPSLEVCLIRASVLRADHSCHQLLGSFIPYTIVAATLLLPYNEGLKFWFDGTHRMEVVRGQKNYFVIQLIMMGVRAAAWSKMSEPEFVETLTRSQIIIIHAFVALFLPIAQWAASSGIEPVRWKLHGNIMPNPLEKDILGAYAGPNQEENHIPQASEEDPFRLLRSTEPRAFSAATLSKARPTQQRPYLSPPEESEAGASSDEDAMETDFAPIMKSSRRNQQQRPSIEPTHTYFNHTNAPPLGLDTLTRQLTAVEDRMQREQIQRQQEQQSRLRYEPPAPSGFFNRSTGGSSTNAGLGSAAPFRRPVPALPRQSSPWSTVNSFSQQNTNNINTNQSSSQRSDFMTRMRPTTPILTYPNSDSNNNTSNAASLARETGITDFRLAKGKLSLPGDDRRTGLEERFDRFFGIDEAAAAAANKEGGDKAGWLGGLMGGRKAGVR